ncbi:MAG: hypothetical protein AB7P02_12980 [Alphaproteobacteria bacterium]
MRPADIEAMRRTLWEAARAYNRGTPLETPPYDEAVSAGIVSPLWDHVAAAAIRHRLGAARGRRKENDV